MPVIKEGVLRLSGSKYKSEPNLQTNGGYNFELRSDEVLLIIEGVEGDSPAQRVKNYLGYGAASGVAGGGVIFATANLRDAESVDIRLKQKQLVKE